MHFTFVLFGLIFLLVFLKSAISVQFDDGCYDAGLLLKRSHSVLDTSSSLARGTDNIWVFPILATPPPPRLQGKIAYTTPIMVSIP